MSIEHFLELILAHNIFLHKNKINTYNFALEDPIFVSTFCMSRIKSLKNLFKSLNLFKILFKSQ